ncbi:membrane protein [Arthrobacter phage Bauer]|uniref:Membrane protein n=1 Tax=Arthrobacter phage Bauer TaxID=2985648 RepID=A0A9E7V2I1_9CAUD|nr:membrane protein [Arthrobacter phage Bauer]UUG69985.1 membrane protein [Arthrobacter phage Zucker]UYM26575.1 membrane protein [Arthrobacter phage Bauer]
MDSLTPEALAALVALGPAALWLMVVSFVLPPVISVIQQSRWSARVQSVVAFVVYLIVAAVWALLNGIFTAASFVVAALVVFVIAGNSYKLLWKPTGIAAAIETATPIADKPVASDTAEDLPAYPSDAEADPVPPVIPPADDDGPAHRA